MQHSDKIVITGAAGLVGQNLVLLLQEMGYSNIIALDKHPKNLATLAKLNPGITTQLADLSEAGQWMDHFADAKRALVLHAQITGLQSDVFIKNNIIATEHVLQAIKQHKVPFTVHISSSVVNSIADDHYTQTKKQQEQLVIDSGITCCILRPTLMFGWFDPKHLGWLSRFMAKMPVFPIPGNGKFLRQPLFSRDFCQVIIAAMQQQPAGKSYDIVGLEEIDYIDMIRKIKAAKKLSTKIIKLPYPIFYALLKLYALFSNKPPFTADQLTALTAGDYFEGCDFATIFNITPTPLQQAFDSTFSDKRYCDIVIER
ncbi:MAG: NAD-dependent epimerase/dehydratase family protein [Coxiellaceae bacterium]|nr:NAD-dependent epimerase/dehydratase family protein [Coxiellaceae bacterium]